MSAPFRAEDAVRWTGGRLLAGDADSVFHGVSSDTRDALAGRLFVAIVGPSHDAHRYLKQALEQGAAGLLVEDEAAVPDDCKVPVVLVPDTTAGLGALAAGHRRLFTGPVIAITGSNGKTTTKEMCAALLSVSFRTHKNRGNLNNHYGLPLTLLAREAAHEVLVVEIGMNHRGEIAPLTALAAPTVGVITNAGTAHIEHLGSRDEIAAEKGDLIAALDSTATAVINGDDARVMAQAPRSAARIISFGQGPHCDVHATDIRDLRGAYAFTLQLDGEAREVEVRGLGDPTISNALAAAAAARAAGASLDDLVAGFSAYQPPAGRMAPLRLGRGTTVIDDTYNANPQSLDAALSSLARFAGKERGVAVLGDMGELGDTTAEAHRDAGRRVATLDIGALVALGDHAGVIEEAARATGLDATRIHVAQDHEDAARAADRFAGDNDWILVKGSRSMQMERVVDALARFRGDA